MCASAPALKVFFRHALRSSTFNSRSSTGPSTKGYLKSADATNSGGSRTDGRKKDIIITTTVSTEALRQSDEGEDRKGSAVHPPHDVELGYLDPEGNHVKKTRSF